MLLKDPDERFFSRHLDDDEELIAVIHKHWLLGFKHLMKSTLLFVAGWVVLYFFPFRFLYFIVAIWSIVWMVSWLRDFYDYYLDAWIITDQGIVDVEWHGWFHRASTRVLYTDVQGVSYEINGVIGTVMRYGTISIEKISTGDAVELCDVSNPRAVEQIVLKAMEQYLHGKNLADSKHVQEILSQLVSQQVQLEEFEEEDDDDDDDNDESEDEEEEDDDDEK